MSDVLAINLAELLLKAGMEVRNADSVTNSENLESETMIDSLNPGEENESVAEVNTVTDCEMQAKVITSNFMKKNQSFLVKLNLSPAISSCVCFFIQCSS